MLCVHVCIVCVCCVTVCVLCCVCTAPVIVHFPYLMMSSPSDDNGPHERGGQSSYCAVFVCVRVCANDVKCANLIDVQCTSSDALGNSEAHIL